jgi:hypothetical protein
MSDSDLDDFMLADVEAFKALKKKMHLCVS